MNHPNMEHIISKFISTAEIGEMKPFGNGHINDTYVSLTVKGHHAGSCSV